MLKTKRQLSYSLKNKEGSVNMQFYTFQIIDINLVCRHDHETGIFLWSLSCYNPVKFVGVDALFPMVVSNQGLVTYPASQNIEIRFLKLAEFFL
jgi:hypothetical protein